MSGSGPRAATFEPIGPLRGEALVPGDKSLSHRALILAAMAPGRSRIAGLCEGADVAATAAALRAMGVAIAEQGGAALVDGVGPGALLQPAAPLALGNSGTSARLLMGLVASHPLHVAFTGDASLSRRPMGRIAGPLRRIGAEIDGDRLPLTVRGLCPALPRRHVLAVPSAQVKSGLLLAALNIPGITEIEEPVPTRDHGERLLKLFGADISIAPGRIALRGEAALAPHSLELPRDPSAAAFLAVAALVVPGSDLLLPGLCVNPRRMGFYRLLAQMGADLRFENEREQAGEPVADLRVRHSLLRGGEAPPALAPDMIDEYPALFIAAAFASGTTRATGLAELRVKESDRIAAMAAGLRAIGVEARETGDGLAVEGSGGAPLPGGARIDPMLDHRVAMAFAVAGLHARQPIGIADMSPTDTSYPGFEAALAGLAR